MINLPSSSLSWMSWSYSFFFWIFIIKAVKIPPSTSTNSVSFTMLHTSWQFFFFYKISQRWQAHAILFLIFILKEIQRNLIFLKFSFSTAILDGALRNITLSCFTKIQRFQNVCRCREMLWEKKQRPLWIKYVLESSLDTKIDYILI